METPRQYKVSYTETAIQDLEEKADYISCQFQDPALALTWYTRLRDAIQRELRTMPSKYPLYSLEPWHSKGIRLFTFRNDVILYSVDEEHSCVYIRAVCTKGRDLSAHLTEYEEK